MKHFDIFDKSARSIRSFSGSLVLLSCSFATVAVAVLGVTIAGAGQVAPPVFAQQRGPVQRIVQGKVQDKSDAPIKGAVVYLKDTRTLAVKSNITDDDGAYRFGQLAQNIDYEIWAESNGKKSATKTISSFDSKNQFYFNLKVDTGK